ncbi:RNA-directed DNA polymerase, partial [Pseudomonas aeruginosa]
NEVTKSDTYPLPRIDDLLQSTKKNCYMTTIDLRSSYWQVMVREADRDKTAFVCPLGTYRFKRMPFGLKNAPATFQRLIDRLRSCAALKDVTVLAYLDDLLIISEGFQQHLQDLEAVFRRLSEFKLHVNREKCTFAKERVRYLGHVITPDGVSPDPEKVSAVLNMLEP